MHTRFAEFINLPDYEPASVLLHGIKAPPTATVRETDGRAGFAPLPDPCQHKGMERERPDHQQADPEIERIVRHRLATLDEDKKSAKDARQALDEIRRHLKHHPAPR